jgi:hypothetical protein
LSAAGKCGSLSEVRRRLFTDIFMKIYETWPNKSLETTAVVPPACNRTVLCPPCLSFLR